MPTEQKSVVSPASSGNNVIDVSSWGVSVTGLIQKKHTRPGPNKTDKCLIDFACPGSKVQVSVSVPFDNFHMYNTGTVITIKVDLNLYNGVLYFEAA